MTEESSVRDMKKPHFSDATQKLGRDCYFAAMKHCGPDMWRLLSLEDRWAFVSEQILALFVAMDNAGSAKPFTRCKTLRAVRDYCHWYNFKA